MKAMYWELTVMVEVCALGAVGFTGLLLEPQTYQIPLALLSIFGFFGAGMILMDVIERYDSDCNLVATEEDA